MIKINLRHHSRAKIKKNQKSILKYASSNKMRKLMSKISSLKRKIRKIRKIKRNDYNNIYYYIQLYLKINWIL